MRSQRGQTKIILGLFSYYFAIFHSEQIRASTTREKSDGGCSSYFSYDVGNRKVGINETSHSCEISDFVL